MTLEEVPKVECYLRFFVTKKVTEEKLPSSSLLLNINNILNIIQAFWFYIILICSTFVLLMWWILKFIWAKYEFYKYKALLVIIISWSRHWSHSFLKHVIYLHIHLPYSPVHIYNESHHVFQYIYLHSGMDGVYKITALKKNSLLRVVCYSYTYVSIAKYEVGVLNF